MRGSNRGLKKNESKLLSALKSEILIQKTESPLVGRTKLKKVYNINEKYLDDSFNREEIAQKAREITLDFEDPLEVIIKAIESYN